jgi:hypothetical protein
MMPRYKIRDCLSTRERLSDANGRTHTDSSDLSENDFAGPAFAREGSQDGNDPDC